MGRGAGDSGTGGAGADEQWVLPGSRRICCHHHGCPQARRVDHPTHELADHPAHRVADDDAHAARDGDVPLPGQGGGPRSCLLQDQLLLLGVLQLLLTTFNINISVKRLSTKEEPASVRVSAFCCTVCCRSATMHHQYHQYWPRLASLYNFN